MPFAGSPRTAPAGCEAGRQAGRPICSLPAIPSLPPSLSDQPAHLPNLYGRQIASDPAGLNLIAARRDRWRWMTCGDQSNTPHHATTGEPCPNPAPPYPDDNEGGLYIFVGKYIKMRMKDETCVCRRLVAFPLPPLSMQRTKTAPQRHRRSHSFWETARYSSAATSDLAVSSSRIHASFGTRPLPPSVRPSEMGYLFALSYDYDTHTVLARGGGAGGDWEGRLYLVPG